MELKKRPAVFLDRDGTINEEVGYVNHPDRFWLLPGVAEAIKRLNDAQIFVIVATNQSGVARGYFDESLVRNVHQKMLNLLQEQGARIDKIYYCPHHPTIGPPEYRKDCQCRKPRTGMINKALLELPIDLKHSYCIGDRIKDVYFGHNAGLKSILVLTGYGRGEYEFQRHTWKEEPEFIAENLIEAVKWIFKDLGIKV